MKTWVMEWEYENEIVEMGTSGWEVGNGNTGGIRKKDCQVGEM